ncbi:ATP-binding cassette domain-containing protein [Cellulomonas sp. NPDC057328]|uniref:ATP-binding cassette domain-containing protein n=1 Tax=Cellulomonas sp. NPDC057328 TaxID=3346101 RepID=UPI00363E51F7
MLQVVDLAVHYRGFTLGPVDLEVDTGTFVSLVGPNGSGKSTLIRSLLGLRRPDTGAALWDGRPLLARDPAVVTEVGYVSDSPGDVIGELTAVEYWQYARTAHERARGTALPHLIDRARDYADRLELPLTAKPLDALSLGTRRKAQVVAALMAHPRLLVLDESFIGLDFLASRAFEGLLRERVADGCTVLSSNHDLDLAARLSDRVVVLYDGSVVLDSDVDALGGVAHIEAAVVDALRGARPARA